MIRHLVVVIGALVLSYAAWTVDYAVRRAAAWTFRINLYIHLIPAALAAALGFLLAAPAWWPRPGAGGPRRVSWGLLALYGVPGLLLATYLILLFTLPLPRLPRLMNEYMLSLGTRTLGGILIGYGLGQAIAARAGPGSPDS